MQPPDAEAAVGLLTCGLLGGDVDRVDMAMNLSKGPFGGHHLGGDSCPPITFEVVAY